MVSRETPLRRFQSKPILQMHTTINESRVYFALYFRAAPLFMGAARVPESQNHDSFIKCDPTDF